MDVGGNFTDRLLKNANIKPGCQALDIGCGTGEVTLRLASFVGAQGTVVGIDTNASALEKASEQAGHKGFENVALEKLDISDLAEDQRRYDVITCRRVLMYLPDQEAGVRIVLSLLKPGGMFVVHEHDASIHHSSVDLPIYEATRSWVWKTVEAEGAKLSTGFNLYTTLSKAGFSGIDLISEAVVFTPREPGQLANIVRVMHDRIVAAGVATSKEMEIDTLERRLAEERQNSGAVSISEMMFGAIARV